MVPVTWTLSVATKRTRGAGTVFKKRPGVTLVLSTKLPIANSDSQPLAGFLFLWWQEPWQVGIGAYFLAAERSMGLCP